MLIGILPETIIYGFGALEQRIASNRYRCRVDGQNDGEPVLCVVPSKGEVRRRATNGQIVRRFALCSVMLLCYRFQKTGGLIGDISVHMIRFLDQVVEIVLSCGMWLGLPLATLLFLQWPLREVFGAYSGEANDIGQWIFAVYVALSVTAATRAKLHLSTDALAQHYSNRCRQHLSRFATAISLVPWAIFVLVTSRHIVVSSILSLERFPDTLNPGYFLVKLALWLLACLILLEGIIELFREAPVAGE